MDVPENFAIQTSGLEHYAGYVKKGPDSLIRFFKNNPNKAKLVLIQSYDKRYTPSTFIEEHNKKYRVGWFATDREFMKEFNSLEEAVADYLLFSFGEERLL